MFLFLNKTEDNKCCFLHFGRGVQDPLSGDQGGGGPWTPGPPPPPGSAPDDNQNTDNLAYTCNYNIITVHNSSLVFKAFDILEIPYFCLIFPSFFQIS